MRPGLALVLALVSASLSGCFTPDAGQGGDPFGARRMFSNGPTGDDVVYLSVAMVERPAGDRALNLDLWELVDEQVLDSDERELLARNGFRVGRVGGSPPPALHELICSERSCGTKPLRVQLRADNPNLVQLGPAWQNCRFHLEQDGRQSTVDLATAQCEFRIVPKLSDGDRVTLRFIPLIKHGELKKKPIPIHLPGGELQWDLQVAQDEETYDSLAWEMTLDSNDTVVIGTRLDAYETIGQRCFLNTETKPPPQRLLVLRVGRQPADPAAAAEAQHDALPLAIQAGLSD